MSEQVAHYDASYGGFAEEIYRAIRQEAFGEDIGQNSWLTADEFRRFLGWLELTPASKLLDIGCGSGGPALFIAQRSGCGVVGVDVNEKGVKVANEQAQAYGLTSLAKFKHVDGSKSLPFEKEIFDAIVCIDAINHLPNRLGVLSDWRRILKPGGRLLFTNPITVTGLLSNEEVAIRSSIGYFLFAPVGEDERLIKEVRFDLVMREDVTENMAEISKRRHNARQKRRKELIQIEGEETFEGQQQFLSMAHRLADERRLSRFVFVARKSSFLGEYGF
jgi:ubiquinone/menaquinone biosynthesis C-methylase UbiE